jgi:hypothetical protein
MRSLIPLFAILALAPAAAQAEEEPEAAPQPGITFPAGAINVMANFEANLSTDRAFKPFSIAPDISYGVSDDLTVAVITSTFGVTGFRGNAGAGVCLAGTDNGCAEVFNNVGVDALYNLARGGFALAAFGGVHALSLDPFNVAARGGVRGRLVAGNLIIAFSPSVFVGLNHRDGGNKEFLWAPVFIGYRATPQLVAGAGTGIKGPLDGFGDSWSIALVPQVLYTLSAKIVLGVSFAMPRILAGDAFPDGSKGVDARYLQAWVSYTL